MEFFLLASAHFLALLSPGPDFFLIGQTALRHPLRATISLISGITLANGIYLAAAIFGLEVLRHSQLIFTILQYLGGSYLVYLGAMLLKTSKRQILVEDESQVGIKQPKFFIRGLLSGILNPKNMVFYLSIFTVMVSETTGLTMRVLYGIWMVFLVFSWDLLLARLIGHQRVKTHLGRSIFFIEKVSGLALASFGIGLTLN